MVRHFCCRLTYGPTFSFAIYSTSAHRRRRCGVGCRGCCRGENHLRMSAPPVRCRLLALEYKPRSCSSARPLRRHDFARPHTDLQPPNSGRTCLIWGSVCCSKQHKKIIRQNENLNHFFTHHLSVWFLVQLPTITCALSASCASRTRVLGLESTDRASHSRSYCGVSADRQLHILSSYGTSIVLHH